jgi:Flp pilus assembly protein TadD
MKRHERTRARRAPAAAAARQDAVPSAEPTPAGRAFIWLVAIPLALVVIAAFVPALDNGFVNWDDEENFLENPFYRGLGVAQVKWAWSTFWVGVYQPLAWMLLEAQYVCWKLDPRGYHLTSLALHAANAVVLYALTVTMLRRCGRDSLCESRWKLAASAGLATALFMVHPLRVEAVAWASCQPYLPCALFSMLAVLAYLRSFGRGLSRRWGWLLGSFLLYLAAVLSKAVAVSLPVVLLIVDYYPLRRFGNGEEQWDIRSAFKACCEKLPFIMVSLVFMGLAVAAKPQSRFSIEQYRAGASVAQACYGVWFYLFKTAIPVDMIAFYPTPRELDWQLPRFFLRIIGTLGTSIGLIVMRRRWPGLLAAWLSYLVILAPNSGLIRISDQIAADRYSYMAMLGLVIVGAAGVCRLWSLPAQVQLRAISITMLGALAMLVLFRFTQEQCRTWHDSETMWNHAFDHGAGESWVAHYNLGLVLSRQGKFDDAAAQFAESVRLDAGRAEAHNNLGVVRYNQGNLEEAAEHYTQALRLNPSKADAHNNLGVVLYGQGKLAEAAGQYTEALRLDPRYAHAHNNLGAVLLDQGRLAEAEAQFAEALRLDPGYGDAHDNLGDVLARGGKYEQAVAQFAEALRKNPSDGEAYHNRAKIMAACPDAKYRDGGLAVLFATRACELTQWKKPEYLDTLAAAHAEAGDFDAAVIWQTKAIQSQLDRRKNDDQRARLLLYQARKPYREAPPDRGASEARP